MNIVLVYSGGLDSTVLLHHLLACGDRVSCLTVDYGQRHRREIDAARSLCARACVPQEVADLRAIAPILSGSALTSPGIPVPLGHYEAETMKATVVPNRNMILLSVAIARAISLEYDAVAYGAHAGDHAIYPDCRESFAEGMASVASLCDWRPIEMLRPFVHQRKEDIVRRGQELGVPFADTWSCYQGGDTHCGLCGTCVERREAFLLAGVPDPTVYAAESLEVGK